MAAPAPPRTRMGSGMPGYAGFVPAQERLVVPCKAGCSQRALLHHRAASAQPGNGGIMQKVESTFQHDFSITPAQFAQGTLPNPLWDIKSKRPVGDPPFIRRPPSASESAFTATSTFHDSYTGGLLPQKYPENVTRSGKLRPLGSLEPQTRTAFYTTEYMHMSEEGNLHMAIKKVLPPRPEPAERANRDITGVQFRHPDLSTSYYDAFGKFGVDPHSKTPNNPSEMKFLSSTSNNMQGTTKASYHLPGYSGFIPESGRNVSATQQALCVKPREGTKNFEMQILFQYPHQVSGYCGYRPKTAVNDVGPVRNESLTTTGRQMIAGTNGFVPGDLGLSMSTLAETAPQRSKYGKSGSLQQTAFSHESMTGALSDNGRHDAEMYFHKTRPMEGRSVAIIKQGHWGQLI